jgi:hypothetical protein
MSARPPHQIESRDELRELQRSVAEVLFRPLTAGWKMQSTSPDGQPMTDYAAAFIKPNDSLSSAERLEIYNRQYWFRVLDCLYDDYPGLLAILGNDRFLQLATEYLAQHPSDSFTLRDLGCRLEEFIAQHPELVEPHSVLARDMARFEWAQIVAFDGPALPILTVDDLIAAPSADFNLGLQPYLSVLQFEYAVDHFVLALKETDALRKEASNAVDSAPAEAATSAVTIPDRRLTYLAVHRYENVLYIKRLESEAFGILTALRGGKPLEQACTEAVEDSPRSGVDWPRTIREWFENWSALGWFCREPLAGSERPPE